MSRLNKRLEDLEKRLGIGPREIVIVDYKDRQGKEYDDFIQAEKERLGYREGDGLMVFKIEYISPADVRAEAEVKRQASEDLREIDTSSQPVNPSMAPI